jgi:glycosyltransferase involved in cell wall biosynthesis
MKRIVIINQSAGHITDDIVKVFSKRFESVVVITGASSHLENARLPSVKLEKIVSYRRNNRLARMFTWLAGSIQIVFLLLLKYRHAYLLFTSNPPFAPLAALLKGGRYAVLIYDIYPDVLVQHKLLPVTALPVKWWEAANRLIFKHADHVFVLSEGMKKTVLKYTHPEKINVISLWCNARAVRPVPRSENAFIAAHGLQDKFLVMYSGNIGYTHQVDVMLDLAAAVSSPEVRFIIIGDGDQRNSLEHRIRSDKLGNCLLLDYQPIEMLAHSLSAADLALVTLGKEASLLSVPSKTFNLIAVGAPLLGVADDASELAAIINRYELGRCYARQQLPEMVAFINELIENRSLSKKMKNNCSVASHQFSPENAKRFADYIN